MKKLMTLLLILSLSFSLCACTNDDTKIMDIINEEESDGILTITDRDNYLLFDFVIGRLAEIDEDGVSAKISFFDDRNQNNGISLEINKSYYELLDAKGKVIYKSPESNNISGSKLSFKIDNEDVMNFIRVSTFYTLQLVNHNDKKPSYELVMWGNPGFHFRTKYVYVDGEFVTEDEIN